MVQIEHKNEQEGPRCLMTLEQVIGILQSQRDQLKRFGVKQIRLFGSITHGSLESQSDVDMVVAFSQTTYRRFIGLKSFLESILGRKVDILTPPAVQGRLKEEIEKDLIDVPT